MLIVYLVLILLGVIIGLYLRNCKRKIGKIKKD